MTSLPVIYRLALSPNPESWLRLSIKPCAICIPDTGCSILVLLTHVHERLLTTLQRCKAAKYTLHCFQSKIFFGMEVWNGIWKKTSVWNGIWNGRFLEWNGKNWQYEIWKNCLPFHTMPCRQLKSNKIACKVNLPVFFFFFYSKYN